MAERRLENKRKGSERRQDAGGHDGGSGSMNEIESFENPVSFTRDGRMAGRRRATGPPRGRAQARWPPLPLGSRKQVGRLSLVRADAREAVSQ